MQTMRKLMGVLVVLTVLVAFSGPAAAEADRWSARGTGGDVLSFAVAPTNSATLYAGTNCGLFTSTDSGTNWTSPDIGTVCPSVGAVAVDPTDAAVTYAGVDGVGIFRTTDGGLSWQSVFHSNGNAAIFSFTFDPVTPGVVYAATYQGAYKSINGGTTWSQLAGIANYGPHMVAVDPSMPTTLYAATEMGMYKSTDGGGSWAAINSGFSQAVPYAKIVLIDPAAPSRLYAVANGTFYRSLDGGQTWSDNSFTNVDSVALDPATGTLYATTFGGGVHRSVNSGLSWSRVDQNLQARWLAALVVDPHAVGTLYLGSLTDGGFKSVDGGVTWSPIAGGLTTVRVRVVAADPTSEVTVYAATYDNGVMKSTNGGVDWTPLAGLPDGDVTSFAVDPVTPTTLYAGTMDGIYKSTDGGNAWHQASSGLISPYSNVIVIDPVTPATVYMAVDGGGVFKTTNGGNSWGPVNKGLPPSLSVATVRIAPNSPQTLYAATDTGVFRSDDGGGTWTSRSTGLTDLDVAAVAVDPATSGTVYAGTFLRGVFKSTDGGESWVQVSPDMVILTLAADPGHPGTVYAGVQTNKFTGSVGGLYRSTDGGTTWDAYGTGLSGITVTTVSFDPGVASRPYVGTWGAGLRKILSAPGAPPAVAAAGGNAEATVNFTPGSTGSSRITSYTVTSFPDGITATGSASPIKVKGLVNSTPYSFTVTATNALGTGPASSPSTAVTPSILPGAPTGVTATAGNAQAVVRFTAPVYDGGQTITSYTVTASPGGITASGSASPITVSGLTNGITYTFTVTAANNDGVGPSSLPSAGVTPLEEIVINNGGTYTISRTVALKLNHLGARYMQFSTNGTTWTAWKAYATTTSLSLPSGDGLKTVSVRYKDGTGVVSDVYSATITLDTKKPTGTIKINAGAKYTNSTSVTLNLTAIDANGIQMEFSPDNRTWSGWEDFNPGRDYKLPSGDGTKKVYVHYKDVAANISSSQSASIILDTTPPTGTIKINNGASTTASSTVTLTMSAKSAVQIQLSNDGISWNDWQKYAPSVKNWTLAGPGDCIVYVKFEDAAGNKSMPASAFITFKP